MSKNRHPEKRGREVSDLEVAMLAMARLISACRLVDETIQFLCHHPCLDGRGSLTVEEARRPALNDLKALKEALVAAREQVAVLSGRFDLRDRAKMEARRQSRPSPPLRVIKLRPDHRFAGNGGRR